MTDLAQAGPLPAISEIDPDALAAWLTARGEPVYRVAQILAGAHRGDAGEFGDLTDLPADLRAALPGALRFSTIEASHVLTADAGLTAKAVHQLHDGQRVESVLMRYPARGRMAERTTICISSQAGCAVGCPFCATGQAGFARQLSPGEIVDQVLHWHRPPFHALGPDWRTSGRRGTYHVVFMGMGEPLNNADRVFEAVRLLNDPQRLGIGARRITVSTSGVVPGINRMVEELPQVNLAISLHAATDELRDELVPINRKWPVASVVDAGRRFADRTGRRVSLEYVMIDGLNDTLEQARRTGRRRARVADPRKPHPAQPDARLALERDAGRRHRPLRRPAALQGRGGHRPRYPRPRDRRGVRSAPRPARRSPAAPRREPRRGARIGPWRMKDVEISASVLNADFARLGEEVRRAVEGGVDSIHLDVMDGHFVDNITMGPVVVQALRPHSTLPFHTHLMISDPRAYVGAFAEAGSDVIVFHVEADDDPPAVIEAIRASGRAPGIALNPDTPAEAVLPYLDAVELLLVMTVQPGWVVSRSARMCCRRWQRCATRSRDATSNCRSASTGA